MIALALSLDLLGEPRLLGELASGRVPSLWATLSLGYLGIGAAMAWHLGRRGHGLGTATSALACWPLLLGLVGRPPPQTTELDLGHARPIQIGPNHSRIEGCMATLQEGLQEDFDGAAGTRLIDAAQLAKLAHSLHRADHRIARVDRLLHETAAQGSAHVELDPQLQAALATLRGARDHAHDELEAVLSGLLSLRVQLGLFALAGESEPVRARLLELEARVAALAELSSVELAQVAS
ncbi:hypothetical protein DB30_03093 [Enhygromyxa salina]|uniref:Uncharacterized protein n=1 Tax=Enhygromyxa salina TaxID=215803 RepID=A0A0C2DD37_9BACT|nr:hypothetical protein [Enhygromyxa salina]KIG17612.1 hypothetical protein DB30_03093 [Enhygromyxa salina]